MESQLQQTEGANGDQWEGRVFIGRTQVEHISDHTGEQLTVVELMIREVLEGQQKNNPKRTHQTQIYVNVINRFMVPMK